MVAQVPAQQPTNHNATTPSGVRPSSVNILMVDSIDFTSELCLPHTIAFQIFVCCLGKNVHSIVLDEGVATCIMSYSCWQDLGSPTLVASKIVLKAFDGHLFTPHGILTAFPVEQGGEIVTVEVEMVNAPLDYNLLIGRSWFYPMKVIASTIYRLVYFPHKGKIVSTINWIIARRTCG